MPVPKGVDPEKYDRCVDDVKAKGGAKNAYAVCAASLKRNELDWSGSDIQKSIDEFNSMFKAQQKAPRASAQAYSELRGVHTASPGPGSRETGRSQAGLYTRIGATSHARERHQAVIREQRKMGKPKLP